MPTTTRKKTVRSARAAPRPKAADRGRAAAAATEKIGDGAVRAKTGRDWAEWFAVLDEAGAAMLDHKGIVALLEKSYQPGPWWGQMIAVAYEQARGLRVKHQKVGGFEISKSKTLAADVRDVFEAWIDAARRTLWLDDAKLQIRKSTANHCIRCTWGDGKTTVEARFAKAANGRTQLTVQHGKLPTAAAAEKFKRYWAQQLARLQETLSD